MTQTFFKEQQDFMAKCFELAFGEDAHRKGYEFSEVIESLTKKVTELEMFKQYMADLGTPNEYTDGDTDADEIDYYKRVVHDIERYQEAQD